MNDASEIMHAEELMRAEVTRRLNDASVSDGQKEFYTRALWLASEDCATASQESAAGTTRTAFGSDVNVACQAANGPAICRVEESEGDDG
jgi:hypothetical protein